MPHPASRLRTWRSVGGPALAVAVTAASWHRWPTAWSLGLLILAGAALVLAAGLPRAWAPVQAELDRLGRALAAALTWVLLVLVFGLVFIPGRLGLAVLRRDPLRRRPEPRRPSYWEPLPRPRGGADYRRPF